MLEHNLYWEVDPTSSRLNAAVSQARLEDIGEQIQYLGNVRPAVRMSAASSVISASHPASLLLEHVLELAFARTFDNTWLKWSAKLYPEQAQGWKFLAILIGANDLCGGCPSKWHPCGFVQKHSSD